jgi:hypothetical protein
MTPDEGRVILLPHPGRERLPNNNLLCDWPKHHGHKRKFMRLQGEWRDIRNHTGTSWLEMWAEYESPTRTEPLDGPPGTAKYVHEVLSTVRAPTLNTDPWIFHPGFVWTTCRQLKADGVRTGDLVLFGSALEGHWVTDTVFAIDHRLDHPSKGEFFPEYASQSDCRVTFHQRGGGWPVKESCETFPLGAVAS